MHNLKVAGSNPAPARSKYNFTNSLEARLERVGPLLFLGWVVRYNYLMDIDGVWSENRDKLTFFVRSKVSNECDAKDLLQQVFLKAKTQSRSLRSRQKAVSWLYQITRNAVVDYYRGRGKSVELPEDLPEIRKEKDAWGLISGCVRPFIEKLPPLYRDALLLSEIEGLDHKQVAKKLGISLAGAKARVQRGRLKLKKKFEDCCIFECGPRGAQVHSDTFGKEE